MKKTQNTLGKSVSLAVGAAFVASAALSPIAFAADNPFGMQKLEGGYQIAAADKAKEGKCGEAKCGADKKAGEKKKDGKCGEAKCGADKKAGDKKSDDKKKDGKCGEGKCGAEPKK